MRIYQSTLFRIGDRLADVLNELDMAGADHVELMLDGSSWDAFETRMDKLAGLLAAQRMVYSVHTPVWDINLTSENAQAREAAMETYRQSVVFAARIGAAHVVLHPGFCYAPVFSKSMARRRAGEAVKALCTFSRAYPTLLLVENVGNRETSIFTEEEYVRFIRQFGGEAGGILDIGHAYLCGWDIPRAIRTLGQQLFAVHLHDNDGIKDTHCPIGEGAIPWDEVFEALRECRPELRLILEYNIGVEAEKLAEGKELLLKKFDGLIEC